MKNSKRLFFLLCLAFTGIACLVSGLVMFFVLPDIVEDLIKSNMILTEDSRSYESWSKLDVPMESKFYVFNVTNPQDVLLGNKPIVKEIGPYVYRQQMSRDSIVFHDDGTVSYNLIPSFYFDRDKSVGPESDTFTALNIPVVAANYGMRFMSSLLRPFAEMIFKVDNEPLFLELTVRDILWGYSDALVTRLHSKLPSYGKEFPEQFGLLYGQNNSKMGHFKIETGENDISKLGSILTLNGESSLSHWTTKQCQMINGSDSTLFPPFMDRTQTLYFYNTFYCRSFPLQYQSDGEISGLKTFQFALPSSAFASPAENPANEGFCTPLNTCPPSGLINISRFNQGLPVFLSRPHFWDADPGLQSSLKGLHPDPVQHDTVMEFEPKTGVVLGATQRAQFSIYVHKDYFRTAKQFDYFYLPIMWLAVNVDSKRLANDIKESLFDAEELAERLTYAAIGVGAFILFCAVIFGVYIYLKPRNQRMISGVDNMSMSDSSRRKY